jgi:hypothetical protein
LPAVATKKTIKQRIQIDHVIIVTSSIEAVDRVTAI